MKLQALISWQVSKNQLQQENEKRRETNFDKKKGKKNTEPQGKRAVDKLAL
jgi:sortase (surface protein transpeptidase)